jgi:hypothetical protein
MEKIVFNLETFMDTAIIILLTTDIYMTVKRK